MNNELPLDLIRDWIAQGASAAEAPVIVSGVVHLEDFPCEHEGWCQVQFPDGTWIQVVFFKGPDR